MFPKIQDALNSQNRKMVERRTSIFTPACGAPFFLCYEELFTPHPPIHLRRAIYRYFRRKKWLAAGEWGFGGVAPIKSAPQASVREIERDI